jgi:hypothetical protein
MSTTMFCENILWLIWKKYFSNTVLCEFDKLKYVTNTAQDDWDLPIAAKFNLQRTYLYE